VISEACFLLDQTTAGSSAVLEMLARKVVRIAFRLDEHVSAVQALRRKYADVPMSVADAALVRMTELFAGSIVLTLDDDFRVYRRHRRQPIPLIVPDLARRRQRPTRRASPD
jgi:hypothetical protein